MSQVDCSCERFAEILVRDFPNGFSVEELLAHPDLSDEDREEIRWNARNGAKETVIGDVACIREGGRYKVVDRRPEVKRWFEAVLNELKLKDGQQIDLSDNDFLLRLDRADEKVRSILDPKHHCNLGEDNEEWWACEQTSNSLIEKFGRFHQIDMHLARRALHEIESFRAENQHHTQGPDDISELPLCKAVLRQDMEGIRRLIADCVELDQRDSNGERAIEYAACFGYLEILKLLHQSGSDIKALGSDGWSLLLTSMNSPDIRMTRYLVEAGVAVTMRSDDGTTPLHIAAHGAPKEVIEYLITSGADVNAMSKTDTPLDCAMYVGNREMVCMLKSHGAKYAMDIKE